MRMNWKIIPTQFRRRPTLAMRRDEGRDDRSSREEGRGRKPSSLSELNSEVGVAVAGMAMGQVATPGTHTNLCARNPGPCMSVRDKRPWDALDVEHA